MFIGACVLVVIALCICAAGIRKALRALELDMMAVLFWLGLAEWPLPSVSSRRR